ncbi:hypothetical protein MLD38_018928 [Melastoma candidum]|uniref:Uncharacterized protein n=1 Tax=Melastoma candidum TaxID=119954 RepID=A0ACB9QVA2_9MYRT|nr:hypothetical protein MLD38_018928 [Melastoma candidum]
MDVEMMSAIPELEYEEEEESGCRTPRQSECRILVDATRPPPAPRKKPAVVATRRGRREPPKGGYFQAPDLEAVFMLIQRREACV